MATQAASRERQLEGGSACTATAFGGSSKPPHFLSLNKGVGGRMTSSIWDFVLAAPGAGAETIAPGKASPFCAVLLKAEAFRSLTL